MLEGVEMFRIVLLLLLAGACWAEPLDLEACARARVLYLGEEHESGADHQRQLDVLEYLSRGRSPVVVAEMFQAPSRQILADYVAGGLNDEELKVQSEWDKRWGHAWDLYLPIWQLCQHRHIPIYPLRNSSESGKNLSKLGSAAFTPAERQGLAPEPYEFGPNPESLRPIFEAHAGPVSNEAFDRFLKVQTLWEEYMAAQIRRALSENEGQVLVLVGQGHLSHGFTLPVRVQRDWPHRLNQRTVVSLSWIVPDTH